MEMAVPSATAVGIDLGTTFSVLARIDQRGRPVTVVNAEGDLLTPSVVLFEGDDIVVGKEALKAVVNEADRVAECSKREVGRRVYHKVLEGKQYPPEVIEALILNKLRIDAEKQIGPIDKAVITVPAYFDEVRRKATQDAGYMAGLEVLDIINEPTAAAVAFGFQQGYFGAERGASAPQKILVYDLGGGTFDVTVMEVRGTAFHALATDGDVRLGGYDWDQRLVDLAAEAFIRQHESDPRKEPTSAGKLWRECEDAKRTLSARQKTAVTCDHGGAAARIEITRQQFEEATQDLLDRTRFTAIQTLQAAGLDWNRLDRVLLVGGSTRMPMVRHMLRELSGKEPDDSVAADEVVAHGAALHASLLLARQAGLPPSFKIKNVNSHSLGVVGIEALTKRRRNGILIPRNTPLPVAAKRTFKTTKAGQRSIRVDIVEGESPSADDCTPVGHCAVRHLPSDLPAQYPVEVTFHYQPNGRLKVRVTLPGTDHQVATEIIRENSLGKEYLDGWRQYISGKPPTDYR
jgi:molecular chaperone DnaK